MLDQEQYEYNKMLKEIVNHIPLIKVFIPGKLVTFGEGYPIAEVVSYTPKSITVKIRLLREIDGIDGVWPVGYEIDVPTTGVRYLE